MKVKIKIDCLGSENGYQIKRFKTGMEYDITNKLANSLIKRGQAVIVNPKIEEVEEEINAPKEEEVIEQVKNIIIPEKEIIKEVEEEKPIEKVIIKKIIKKEKKRENKKKVKKDDRKISKKKSEEKEEKEIEKKMLSSYENKAIKSSSENKGKVIKKIKIKR